ncbi:MAG: PTS glucose transporter subunit IIA, partial [Ruminococcaceae bacterium]|nr:PTS glucose transporter subunit IIA [Oscillospiraceae bacterium]
KATERFSVSATRFMSGKFPFMIFGLPAAAYAMYRTARPEKRRIVGGLLLSAALTAMLTGITEPIEFTFLFVSPILYAIHCVLAGLSYMLTHIFGVGVGMTFSGGIIDLTLFGILQGNEKTRWLWIVAIGAVYAVIYYFLFSIMIKKLNLKTPGREADDEETKLYTRKDYNEKKSGKPVDGSRLTSALILKGLGGSDNIADIDACATRLRVTVKNPAHVSDTLLKQSGASGVIHKGAGVQIIYGPRVAVIKSELEDFMETPDAARLDEIIDSAAPAKNAPPEKKTEAMTLAAHAAGKIVPLAEVEDDVFAKRILGDGIAIEPSEGRLYAPCDATVAQVFDTGHAVNLMSDGGMEILLHIGIDTVELGGRYFTAHVSAGQTVKRGDLLISFDMEGITGEGYKLTTPMIVCNSDEYAKVEPITSGTVSPGRDILRTVKSGGTHEKL